MASIANPGGTSTAQVESANTATKLEAQVAQPIDWNNLPDGHVLVKMSEKVGEVIKEAGYSEMYGVELVAPSEGQKASPFSTLLILQKFLRANSNDVSAASTQLLNALKWRKEFKPLEVKKEVFSKTKFEGLGYVVRIPGVPESTNETDVATFNIYGAVKSTKETFGDLKEFIKWRVALMELTLETLNLSKATTPIPDHNHGPDPHQAIQVHDYLSVSFLRQPSEVKTASREAISIFSANYPETLSKKYFVNVPLVMQWMFSAMQVFMAKETIRKMQWMSYGSELHKYLGSSVAKEYGGTGPDIQVSGVTPRYDGGLEGKGKGKEVDVGRPSQATENEMQAAEDADEAGLLSSADKELAV